MDNKPFTTAQKLGLLVPAFLWLIGLVVYCYFINVGMNTPLT